MKKYIVLFCFTVYCLLFPVRSAHAAYVLPYPSYMPGNMMYKVSRVIDYAKQYWYWGNIAKVKYYLGLSDKYLVEAKTLFEYKQYLLGADALVRSTAAFAKLPEYVQSAKTEGKDMALFVDLITQAGDEHLRVLDLLEKDSPDQFRWTPEKASASDLMLHADIEQARNVTRSVLEEIRR